MSDDRCGAVSGGLTCDREKGHDGDHRGYNAQIDEAMFWRDRPAAEERFEAHTRAVEVFLNELYAVMVDPCAEGTITVDEMKAALLAAAVRDRDAAHARRPPDQLTQLAHELAGVLRPNETVVECVRRMTSALSGDMA